MKEEANIPKGPPSKNGAVMYSLIDNLKMLSVLFLSILLLFPMVTTVVSAETGEHTNGDTISGEAQASAVGEETHTSTEVVISEDKATATATSRAKAENGGTATAEATVQIKLLDTASAYAHAIATVVAGVGEIVWAEANAVASITVSDDDTVTSSAQASATGDDVSTMTETVIGDIGNGGGGNGNDNGNGNPEEKGTLVNPVIITPPKDESFFGFVFGKSDVERYYYFKHQLENNNGLSLADNNMNITARAKYYMEIIASDSGLNESEFESKFSETNTSISELKDYYR